MATTLQNAFVALRSAFAAKGNALDAHWGREMARNANGMLAYRVPQTIMSGFIGDDYGTWASISSHYQSAVTGTDYLGPRGRAPVWKPFDGTIKYAARATRVSGQTGVLTFYAGDSQWTASTPLGKYSSDSVNLDGSTSAFEDITGSLANVPLDVSGMVYCYIVLRDIEKLGAYSMWVGDYSI